MISLHLLELPVNKSAIKEDNSAVIVGADPWQTVASSKRLPSLPQR